MFYYFRMLIVAVFAIQSNSIVSQTVDCNNLPTDFHFAKQVNIACPGDSLTFTVNDIGADRYYWTIPSYMGTYMVDEQFFAGVRIQGTWNYTIRPLSIYGQYRYAVNDRAHHRIIYSPNLPHGGLYRVFISYFAQENNKKDVPITVVSDTGTAHILVDQTIEPESGTFHYIGTFSFEAGAEGSVTIGTDGTSNEFVIADAVRFELISFADDTSISLYARPGTNEVICVEAQFSDCPQRIETCTNPINIGSNMRGPQIILQEDSVCLGVSYIFSVEDEIANSFIWHLPSGMSINGQFGDVLVTEKQVWVHMENAQGENSRIGVSSLLTKCSLYSDTSYSNIIRFKSNDCPLPDPEFTSEPKEICIGIPALFSVNKIEKADAYEWTLPEGLQENNTGRSGKFRTTEPFIWITPIEDITKTYGQIFIQAFGEAIHPSIVVHTKDSIRSAFNQNPIYVTTDATSCAEHDGEINLSNLNNSNIYTISYYFDDQLTYLPNTTTDSFGNIVIKNLSGGKYDSLKISFEACYVLFDQIYVNTPDLAIIKDVKFERAKECDQKNKITLQLENSTEGQLYDIDYDNNGVYENKMVSYNNALFVENIENGTLIENISIRNSITNCVSYSDFQYYFAPLVLEKEDLQCIPEYNISILWDENETYAFTDMDKKIIPTITNTCLKDRVNINFSFESGSWIPEDKFVQYRFSAIEDQMLFWEVSDEFGNSQTCETIIKFHYEYKAPSAFSPNGDGVNDSWQIDFLQVYPNCHVSVFNRIGIKIFESKKGYPQSWDGRQGGSLVPVDTYYYVISLGENGIIYKGTLSIVY